MGARTAERIESAADAGAAAVFAAAVGYALFGATRQSTVALAGLPAFALCLAGLRRINPVRRAHVPAAASAVTHLLAEADRSIAHAEDELVLDDILAALDPDSRVVRLFPRPPMPTPGQLKDRIDRHLEAAPAAGPESDGAQALHDALAELRRSLK